MGGHEIHDQFDPLTELLYLEQTGTVQDYYDSFIWLRSRVTISEDTVIEVFLRGLETDIQKSVRLFNPKVLQDAYSWARLKEFSISVSGAKEDVRVETCSRTGLESVMEGTQNEVASEVFDEMPVKDPMSVIDAEILLERESCFQDGEIPDEVSLRSIEDDSSWSKQDGDKRPAPEVVRAVNKFKADCGGHIVSLERVQPSADHVPHRYLLAGDTLFASFVGTKQYKDIMADANILQGATFHDDMEDNDESEATDSERPVTNSSKSLETKLKQSRDRPKPAAHRGFLARAKGIPALELYRLGQKKKRKLVLCGQGDKVTAIDDQIDVEVLGIFAAEDNIARIVGDKNYEYKLFMAGTQRARARPHGYPSRHKGNLRLGIHEHDYWTLDATLYRAPRPPTLQFEMNLGDKVL